jgi:hypothetical protein
MVSTLSNADRGSLLGPIDTVFGGEKSFKRDLDESKALVKSNTNPQSDITEGGDHRTS